MRRYVIVGLTSGILFGALDAVINANPLAQRLYEVYRPIARASVNAPAGVAIDLAYGFVLAGIFLLLYRSLPGGAGWVKGISFGLLASFFGVVMASVSSFMMFNVPAATLAYALLTRLGEMLALGILYGLTLRPKTT
ncbi:MAG: hypothetical protein ABSA70_16455 [Terriglobia bacterium]